MQFLKITHIKKKIQILIWTTSIGLYFLSMWSSYPCRILPPTILKCVFDVQKMIHLIPTKTSINEKWIDVVVPRPRRLLEPVQDFLEFAHKVFFSFFYKILWLLHVVFASIWWILQSMAIFNTIMHLLLINMATRAKVLLNPL